jgi:uncharacterized protein DUF6934
MNAESYNIETTDNFLEYAFYSEGPKGRIKKVIRFTPQNAYGTTYFNVGFGDWDYEENNIDDLVITNNYDRDKVLATVAATVLDFTEYFPNALVYAKGSTPARTRLYQIGIVSNWMEINQLLHVFGFTEKNGWERFVKNFNYEAFMVFRK